MVYKIDERQLLNLWIVISCLSCIREIDDPLTRPALLTQAQIYLTAVVLDLQQAPEDEARSASPIADFAQVERFDA